MSKRLARSSESYETEVRLFEEAVRTVEANGFTNVRRRKSGPVKLIDAASADGHALSFWLKLGWSDVPYAAIQFGMFTGADGAKKSDDEFVEFVRGRVANIKALGATHALLFHKGVLAIALRIDDVVSAYGEQMKRFPATARNTKSPTMWFYDPRPSARTELAAIVRNRAIPLPVLAAKSAAAPDEPEARSRMAEVEARVLQAVFRNRVGARCGWRCAVTGSVIREALDAAHLPGRDWRVHNDANDGILLRADIHRLVDAGLATIEGNVFRVSQELQAEYGPFDGKSVFPC